MGFYIEPKDMTKEQWLTKNGRCVMGCPEWRTVMNLHSQANYVYPVVLVDNGQFKVAAILNDERELRRFRDDGTRRPKLYFLVEEEKLLPWIPKEELGRY
jgi:hypothetical protein